MDDGVLRELDPGFIPVERFGWWINNAIVGGIILLGIAIMWLMALGSFAFILPVRIGLTAGGLALIGLLMFAALKMPGLVHRHTRYSVSPLGLQIRRGIWWKHVIDVPRSRIQHTDVRQGPIQRRHGIGTLIVYTAGTTFASVELAGLRHEVALQIRDYLIRGEGGETV